MPYGNNKDQLESYLVENLKDGFSCVIAYTWQPLKNTVRYNTVLDITRFKDGSQKCIDYIEKWP